MAPIASLLAGVGLAVLGASHAIRTYLEHAEADPEPPRRVLATDGGGASADDVPAESRMSREVLDQERVRAYREIMASIIKLNRRVVEMGADELREEADDLVHGRDSVLDEPHANVTETYQSYYHVISPTVRDAVSGYADYLVTYHDDGAKAGELLSQSGAVAEAMRSDFGLESLFNQQAEGTVAADDSENYSEEDS